MDITNATQIMVSIQMGMVIYPRSDKKPQTTPSAMVGVKKRSFLCFNVNLASFVIMLVPFRCLRGVEYDCGVNEKSNS